MKDSADITKCWLLKSKNHMIALEASWQAGALDAACFHAQRAAAMLFMSFLSHSGIELPLEYDLTSLIESCEKADGSFSKLLPVVETLTPFTAELCDSPEFRPMPEDVAKAQTNAFVIRDFVAERLPDEITQ